MSVDLKAGMALPAIKKKITQEKICDFAEISGGTDPIHVDPEYAATTEFKSTLAHGLMQVGYISESLYQCFGEQWLSNSTIDIKFVAPVKVGQEITTQGTVERIVDYENKKKVFCRMSCLDENGPVIVADVTVYTN